MCDTVAGELLVSFRHEDAAARMLIEDIRNGKIEHVTHVEDLTTRLSKLKLSRRKLQFEFHRLRVPEGDESFKMSYLQFFYKGHLFDALGSKQLDFQQHKDILLRSNYHLQIVPNSVLSLRAGNGDAGRARFSFSDTHELYKKMVGLSATKQIRPAKRVLVLDTGIDPEANLRFGARANFVDDSKKDDVTDDHGHGTAVVSVISDLCPSVEFSIYKVADSNGRASEWDLLAALAADHPADVINTSLAFGLPDKVCGRCGRESRSSRSAVFENMLDELHAASDGPLLIAAAGNEGRRELSFPARFANVIAVASIRKNGELSSFSNRAVTDQVGQPHQNVYVLPGGEQQADFPPSEYVGVSATGTRFWGTSFSTAYATALATVLWSQPEHAEKDHGQFAEELRSMTDRSLPNYSASTHGNGMLRFEAGLAR